ncbi:class I SAM-dependent methyltransferase [Actinoplanes sp. NBC_00393]|uniref:class I SAM-dependent methyltransferase n=1 Tax=Actinoplanes sp. NBC_00393 TaxID=2975953 RepID=UPI002E24A0B0
MNAVDYDAELIRYRPVLHRFVEPHDRVLDVGCGAGQTTRDAARAAVSGSALGVDVSAPAIERARTLADGLRNVAFERADVQTHRFEPGSFDLTVSRFGTMFFADPVAAFSNIAAALRPGGRLAMLVWQAGSRNDWHATIRSSLTDPTITSPQAAAPQAAAPQAATPQVTGPVIAGPLIAAPEVAGPEVAGPDPFSFADPATVTPILDRAGFADIDFAEVREPVYYGPDADAALDWVRGFAYTRGFLKAAAPATAAAGLARLQGALSARATDAGVWFDARAWLVTARRR